MKRPSQLVIGPGRIGRKLPIIPKIIKRLATIVRNMSIYIFNSLIFDEGFMSLLQIE
ncbi:hypothetical protein GCM10022257_04780 [Hyunsoonleella aestuarii]|uniref:Uncharacterized protein n=1 Tax=Hyunsoonleella aestuarii TaxID=912802 RepID=A0ABP8E7Z3_9FLAO